MKHLVNFGLLFFFVTLLASGVMRFLQPFALTVTRVHICCGFALAILVCLHLSSQGKYFRGLIRKPINRARSTRNAMPQIAGAVALWAYALAAALWNLWPVPQLIDSGYEAQHAREIFRPHDRVAYMSVESGLLVHRGSTSDTGLRIEFDWGPAFGRDIGELNIGNGHTQLAIWAENEEGTVLETIFVSESCAAAESLEWGGHILQRQDILPVWHARYKDMLGKEPDTEVDGVSSATPVRDFSLDGHLKTDALPFALFVEVNAPNDTNRYFHPEGKTEQGNSVRPGIGQPSVLYEARIYPSDNRQYYLMDLIGHSGRSEIPDRDVDYDLGNLTTAKKLIDKILIKVTWPKVSQRDQEVD